MPKKDARSGGKGFASPSFMQRCHAARHVEQSLVCWMLLAFGCADMREAEPRALDPGRAGGAAIASAEVPGASSDADASPPGAAEENNAWAPELGVYHRREPSDPTNLVLRAFGSFSWEMHGCDYGLSGGGHLTIEGGRIVLSPIPGASNFGWIGSGGHADALEVQLESGPEPGSLIARVEWDSGWRLDSPEEQRWDRGRRCLVCDPALLCACTQEPCGEPVE
jgi:hypothetical protein